MIAGKDAFKPGEAKNSWLTGTAAWNYYAITQYILGIKPNYNGLLIDPCIPNHWEGFKISRNFRGSTFCIEVENPNQVSKGIATITVNGQAIAGNEIPLSKEIKSYQVKVVMG